MARTLRVRTKEREGRITTKGRRGLSRSQFGLLNGRGPGQAGRYPIDTEARARNALARAAQQVKAGNLTPSQAATIRRRVKSKYPGIEVTTPRQRK